MVTSQEIAANPFPVRDRRREVTVRTHVAIAPNLILSLPVMANPTDSMIGCLLSTAVAQALVLPGILWNRWVKSAIGRRKSKTSLVPVPI